MPLLILAVLVLVGVWWLRRAVRLRRQQWLHNLALRGDWVWVDAAGMRSAWLQLRGAADHGDYREATRQVGTAAEGVEVGTWRVDGTRVVLEPHGGPAEIHDLRLFANGELGLHGPRRPNRIYTRGRDNVVELQGRRPGGA